MQSNPNYLGRFSLGTYSVRLNRNCGALYCDFCGLRTVNDPDVALFMVISVGNAKTGLNKESLNACVFCSQALTLSPDCMADGVLYLLPDLDQASVIRLVVAANCFVFAEQLSDKNMPNDTRQMQVQFRARCVKAGRVFLDTLSRLGGERTTAVSRQAIFSQDLASQLRNLESGEPQVLALKNASKSLRFVPIMSARNMPIINFLSKTHWGLPESFARCITAFENVQRKLAERGLQNPPS